ncbi:MAG: DUF6206 family protein [Candidatus Binatia bacterium]
MTGSPCPGDSQGWDADLAVCLIRLEARYGHKTRLARILNSATVRQRLHVLASGTDVSGAGLRGSVLGGSRLQGLWRAVSELTDMLGEVSAARLRTACEQWTGGSRGGRFVSELFGGREGVLAIVARESVFLAQRRACVCDPTPARVRALARATPGFGADLLADVRSFRAAMRQLHLLVRVPLVVRPFGFGEISRPVGLVRRASPLGAGLAPAPQVYKRLAPFPRAALAEQYVRTYMEYNRRLRDDVGIAVPDFGWRTLGDGRGRVVVITTQAALDPDSIGKAILLRRDAEQCRILFRMILAEYRKVIRYNGAHRSSGFQIGVDGQIPNWAVGDYRGDDAPLRGDESLLYVDTNTPMMRRSGKDCLPMEFYLQALPRVLRPLVRPLARRVLNRYFNPRTILLDFLANTSIHGRGQLIQEFLPEANAFLREGLIMPVPEPITQDDVKRYIASDVATWRLTRSMRQLEEMLQGRRGPLTTLRRIHGIWTRPIF